MYRLSIIIPVFNVEKYIIDCLNSLYQQNLSENDFEIILINDGSTDQSANLINSFSQSHSNIKMYYQKNSGPSAARNLGIQKAIGEYLLFIDSDDFLLPNKIPLLLQIAEKNQLEVLRADYLNSKENGKIVKYEKSIISSRRIYSNKIIKGDILYSKIFCMEFFTPLLLLNRTFILKNNLYFHEGIYFEDIDFSTRLSLVVTRAMFTPITFYIYRLRENSITHSINLKKVKDLTDIINTLQNSVDRNRFNYPMKQSVLQNITHLSVYLFIRLSEPLLYPHKKEILSTYKVGYLSITGGLKEKIIAILYNLTGKHLIRILHPFVYVKLQLIGGGKTANKKE